MSFIAKYGSVLFSLAGILCFVALGHFKVGKYPEPLPQAENKKREIIEVLGIWGINFTGMWLFWWLAMSPDKDIPSFRISSEISIHFYSLLVLATTIGVEVLWRKRDAKELGLKGISERWFHPTMMGLVLVGIWSAVALTTGTSQEYSYQYFIYFLFTPAFLEEWESRSVYQTKMERVFGVKKAWIFAGILFGLLHIPTDFYGAQWISVGEDIGFALLNLFQQISLGWIFGLIFTKTRSIWPAVIIHYLYDFLPNLIVSLGIM